MHPCQQEKSSRNSRESYSRLGQGQDIVEEFQRLVICMLVNFSTQNLRMATSHHFTRYIGVLYCSLLLQQRSPVPHVDVRTGCCLWGSR